MTLGDLLFRALGLLLIFSALVVVAYVVVKTPPLPRPWLGLRGLKRQRALRDNSLWRAAEPLVRWLGAKVGALFPKSTKTKLRHQITLSGEMLGLGPDELIGGVIFCGLAGASVGALYGATSGSGIFPAALGFLLGVVVPWAQLGTAEAERRKLIQMRLPPVIDLLALGLSAGMDFPGALRQVTSRSTDTKDYLVEELGLILHELEVGKTRKQALAQFAERAPFESVKEFTNAVIQAEERGTPLERVLRIQAETSRQRRSVSAEEAAAKAGVKMMAPMLMSFVCVMLLIFTPMIFDLLATFK